MTAPISSDVAASGSAMDSRSRDSTSGSVGSATMPSVTFLRWIRSIEVTDAIFMFLEHPTEPRLERLHRAGVDLGGPRLGHEERFPDLPEGDLFVVVESGHEP